MFQFADPAIQYANIGDVADIVQLLNNAYRGEASKRGWTTEAHLIGGNVRTDEADVLEAIERPGSSMLKYLDESTGQILGCVNLQKHESKIYLGMFAVNPGTQGLGIGKKLLKASEAFAVSVNCHAIYMTVITQRKELIDWYCRHGYSDTGERKPFVEDAVSGPHLQPLDFMILEKSI